jgi:hypothetical protein
MHALANALAGGRDVCVVSKEGAWHNIQHSLNESRRDRKARNDILDNERD